jgi:hypothetical protein
VPLIDLGNDTAKVAAKHDTVTMENGPYIANGSMRTLRAVYKRVRKTNRKLPADNSVGSIDLGRRRPRLRYSAVSADDQMPDTRAALWQPAGYTTSYGVDVAVGRRDTIIRLRPDRGSCLLQRAGIITRLEPSVSVNPHVSAVPM